MIALYSLCNHFAQRRRSNLEKANISYTEVSESFDHGVIAINEQALFVGSGGATEKHPSAMAQIARLWAMT